MILVLFETVSFWFSSILMSICMWIAQNPSRLQIRETSGHPILWRQEAALRGCKQKNIRIEWSTITTHMFLLGLHRANPRKLRSNFHLSYICFSRTWRSWTRKPRKRTGPKISKPLTNVKNVRQTYFHFSIHILSPPPPKLISALPLFHVDNPHFMSAYLSNPLKLFRNR